MRLTRREGLDSFRAGVEVRGRDRARAELSGSHGAGRQETPGHAGGHAAQALSGRDSERAVREHAVLRSDSVDADAAGAVGVPPHAEVIISRRGGRFPYARGVGRGPGADPQHAHFFPLPSTPTPFVLMLAVPETPYTVLAPPAVAVPCTPFALAAVDEFVPVTAGVAVVLENVPTAAMAAVGMATAAMIATQTIVVSCRLVNGPQLFPAVRRVLSLPHFGPTLPAAGSRIRRAFHPGRGRYNGPRVACCMQE